MNQEQNNLNPKKINLGLIIGIVVAILAVIVIVGIIVLNNNKNASDNNSSKQNGNLENDFLNNTEIRQFFVNEYSVVALTEKNELYAIGNKENRPSYFSTVTAVDNTTLIASNVKRFLDDGSHYIDINGNLYISGVDVNNGGMFDSFEKIGENIYDASCMLSGGLLAISNDKDLYIYGKSTYHWFVNDYKSLTKLSGIRNVKQVSMGLPLTAYIDEDNNLYVKEALTDTFTNVLDNVDVIYRSSLNNLIVKTVDNKIYEFDVENGQIIKELQENVKSIIKSSDCYDYYMMNDGSIIHVNNHYKQDFSEVYPEDVKDMLYISKDKMVYLNNDNKIVLFSYSKNGKTNVEKLPYKVSSMKKIYNFVYDEEKE